MSIELVLGKILLVLLLSGYTAIHRFSYFLQVMKQRQMIRHGKSKSSCRHVHKHTEGHASFLWKLVLPGEAQGGDSMEKPLWPSGCVAPGERHNLSVPQHLNLGRES